MDPKYKLKERVIVLGNTEGEIMEVYPANPWRPTPRYKVYLSGSPGATIEVWERDIEPWVEHPLDWGMLCTCGSKHVYGFENCHAFWCQAYVKPGGKE